MVVKGVGEIMVKWWWWDCIGMEKVLFIGEIVMVEWWNDGIVEELWVVIVVF